MAFDRDVPVATNIIAADLAAININWEHALLGDGTAGRVLRVMQLKVEEGTNANTIKCTPTSLWNATTTPGTTDNITKDGVNTGHYNLAANGQILKILAAGIDGNNVAIVGFWIWANTSTVPTDPRVYNSTNDIAISLYDATDGTIKDIEEDYVEAAKEFYLTIAYLTSA